MPKYQHIDIINLISFRIVLAYGFAQYLVHDALRNVHLNIFSTLNQNISKLYY